MDITGFMVLLLGGSGVIGLLIQLIALNSNIREQNKQFRLKAQSHLSDIFRYTLNMGDETRDQRQYVHDIEENQNVFIEEAWLSLPKTEKEVPPEQRIYFYHMKNADSVCRTFDRMGLLLREGVIPVDVVAHFYASPIIRSWYTLYKYIEALRKKKRQQGHFWEFENMVYKFLIPNLQKNEGIWKGVEEHDQLQEKILHIQKNPLKESDVRFSPPDHYWYLNR